MIKCYKITSPNNGSVIVPPSTEFYQLYGTGHLVDMGMVFVDRICASVFYYECSSAGRNPILWEAECSYLEPFDRMAPLIPSYMRRFWRLWGKPIMGFASPQGTHIGFDIRLVRRIP